jgi:hypothetical protein
MVGEFMLHNFTLTEVTMARHLPPRLGIMVLFFVFAIPFLSELVLAQQGTPGSWCVLRRHNVYEPTNCYEFFLCDTIRDVQRCGLANGGGCGVGPLGLREGWQVDPNAHPFNGVAGPYTTWQGADYVMTVLGRYSGDWYGCLGPRKMELPQRAVVRDGPSDPGFCILRKPIPQWPANCFEFLLTPGGSTHATIAGGVCFVTSHGARENWSVDPNMGGPFLQRGQAQAAHDRLHRFAGNFYGCPTSGGGGGDGGGGIIQGNIEGLWRRDDSHEVRFSGGGGSVIGTITKLTPLLAACHFKVGEVTFELRQTNQNTYQGRIKVRSSDGSMWWQDVTMSVQGNRMTGGGNWVRIQ